MNPSQLLDALRFRYAAKAFDASRRIPDETWSALEESLRLTPSSFGLQPWKFLVVDTPELRTRLRAASWNQSQITDASNLVVFTARTDLTEADIDRWIDCMAGAQNKSRETLENLRRIIIGFISPMSREAREEWNTRQIYIALGQFMASAAFLGVDTCPIEGLDRQRYDEILELSPTGYRTVCACAVGYRDPADPYSQLPKSRFPLDEVVRRL